MSRKNLGVNGKNGGFHRKSEDILKISPSTPTSPNFRNARRLTEYQSTPDCFTTVSIDSPLMKYKISGTKTDLTNENGLFNEHEDSSMITVGVRVRPFTQRELVEDMKCIISMNGNETVVTQEKEKGDISRFTYDYSFWSFDESSPQYADQVSVYEALGQPLIVKVLQGYNACLFAYGQTGSGKSYSIMGHGKDVGVVPRFCEELFQKIHDKTTNDSNVAFNVELSFFEVYNEKIHDLLVSSCGKDKCKKSLKVREHPVMGPFVDGLSSYVVKSFDDVSTWLGFGNKRRATASTCMNDNSSRSHSVFTLVVTQTKTSVIEDSKHKHNVTSKINLVDLAGSERQSTAKTTGDRLREGSSINKSLMALGKVISILSEQPPMLGRNRKNFIPYRETILTWLLKESLGGNSKTSMLATISPSSLNVEESLSTLRYARQARNIVNTARINEDQNARMIRNLQAEIEKLRMMTGRSGEGECLMEIKNLKDELLRKEMEMLEMNRTWQEKLKLSEACKQEEEAQLLEKFGVSSKVDPDLPCLMNLNEDPQLSEVLLYVIKEGSTSVGRMRDDCDLDIQLDGALIADEHCKFDYRNGVVSITPTNNSACYVNGHDISNATSTIIHSGDRIVLAGDHFFRFFNPREDNVSEALVPSLTKNFHFAYQEFTTMQNARLEDELRVAKERHTDEMKMMRRMMEDDMQQHFQTAKEKAEHIRAEYEARLEGLKGLISEHQNSEMKEHITKLEKEREYLERQMNAVNISENYETPCRVYDLEFIESMERDAKEFIMNRHKWDFFKKCDESHKLSLMLKEANNISSLLLKDLKFTRDYLSNDELVIKVQKPKMNIYTLWSTDKFKSKLQEMKDLYQGRTDASRADEILFDARDVWESEMMLSCPRQNIPHSSTFQSIVSSSFFECSMDSFDISLSESKINSKQSKYSQMIQISLQDFKESTPDHSTADRLLFSCERIRSMVNDLKSHNQGNNKVLECHDNDKSLMHLVHSFNSLQVLASQWLLQLGSSNSDVISSSRDALFNDVSNLGNNVQLFIQGLDNNISSIIVEFYKKILEALKQICFVSGKLSLSCQLDCYSLKNIHLVDSESNFASKVDVSLKKAYLSGCNEFIVQALSSAKDVLDESKRRLMDLNREKLNVHETLQELLKRTLRTVSSTILLLQKLETLQLQLTDSEDVEPEASDVYLASFLRCKSLCLQFSSIVDSALQLIDVIESIVLGEANTSTVENLKSVLEGLNEHLCRLMDSTNLATNQSVRLEDSRVGDFLNETQMEMLGMAVVEVKEAINDLSCLAFPDIA